MGYPSYKDAWVLDDNCMAVTEQNVNKMKKHNSAQHKLCSAVLNKETCTKCSKWGDLILCDGCPHSYHLDCIGLTAAEIPAGKWYCNACVSRKLMDKLSRRVIMRSKRRGGPILVCECDAIMKKGNVYAIRDIKDADDDSERLCDLCDQECMRDNNEEWWSCVSQTSKSISIHGDHINSGIDICTNCSNQLISKTKR